MNRYAQRHSGRHAQRFVNATKIVEGNPKRDSRTVIFEPLAESVGEPRKTTGRHSRREIEALDV
jgi:hypothetical protein